MASETVSASVINNPAVSVARAAMCTAAAAAASAVGAGRCVRKMQAFGLQPITGAACQEPLGTRL